MLGSIGQTLSKTKKNKLFRQAYMYDVLKKRLREFILNNLDRNSINPEILETQITLKEDSKNLKIYIQSKNSTFSAWLKTNIEEINTAFRSKLTEKGLANKSTIIETSFKLRK